MLFSCLRCQPGNTVVRIFKAGMIPRMTPINYFHFENMKKKNYLYQHKKYIVPPYFHLDYTLYLNCKFLHGGSFCSLDQTLAALYILAKRRTETDKFSPLIYS